MQARKRFFLDEIGRNEISTIRVCQELVAAEKEYRSAEHAEYAQKIYSDEGQHNGLYWKVAEGEPPSPIGPLVASAVAQGYARAGDGAPTRYRGYYYHILTRQGKNAPGGVNRYIVNQDGVVYQKDLGKRTEAFGKAMQEYNPDSSWSKTPPQITSGEKR
jgi:hypothetical protein